MDQQIQDSIIDILGKELTLVVRLPDNMPTAVFPLTLDIEPEKKSIYPEVSKNRIPVTSKENYTFSYQATITYEDYQRNSTFFFHFKTNMEAYQYPPTFFPAEVSVSSYLSLFTQNNQFFVYYVNNFIVSGITAIICTLVAIITGYAIARFNIKWTVLVAALLVFTQMFPIVSRMISLYGLMSDIGMINTRTGLILAISAAQIPFCATLMSSFFRNVPKEIEEAAYVDGAGRNRILFSIITPLVKPGMLAVGIYAFLQTWDDYLHAATLIQSDNLRTLSIGISLRYLGEVERMDINHQGVQALRSLAALASSSTSVVRPELEKNTATSPGLMEVM